MSAATKTPAPTLFPAFERRDHFGGATHSYRLDGKKIPSVTGLLKGIPKPALVNWAAGQAAEYACAHWDELARLPFSEKLVAIKGAANMKRNAAALKGTTVHAYGARLVHGERIDGIPDEVAAKVDRYVDFLNEWKVEPIAVERAICNTTMPYGGTFDIVFRTPLFPGQIFLADIKTSGGVYGETALQLEAYSRADFFADDGGGQVLMSELGITDHAVIHLEESRYRVIRAVKGDEPWEFFRAGAVIANAMDGGMDSDLSLLVSGEIYKPGEAWL